MAECAIDRHRLRERPRKPGSYTCEVEGCGFVFPCEDRFCGHSDCIFERGEVRCWYCHRVIEDEPEPNVRVFATRGDESPRFSYFSFGIKGSTKAAHTTCYDAAMVEKKAEDARRASIANGIVPEPGEAA